MGARRTDTDFRGEFLLVYFGYTYCPDVCPTDLTQIAAAIDGLAADSDKIQPLFISAGPPGTSAERMIEPRLAAAQE